MKITFEPSICKPNADGTAAEYSGTVTINLLSYDERLEIYEKYALENADAPEEQEKPSAPSSGELIRALKPTSSGGSGVKFMRYAARQAKNHVTEISIKRLADGYEFTHWDQLNYDSDMGKVISEITGKLVGKFSMGNDSAPS